MTTEKLLGDTSGYYDPVPCPICGNPLHLIYSGDQFLYASFTQDELNGIRPRDTESWEVRCEAGHVVLLPCDDGQESHLFGVCPCDPGEDHLDGCALGDFMRLKEVIELAKRDCPNCIKGKVRTLTGKTVDCPHCEGTGKR